MCNHFLPAVNHTLALAQKEVEGAGLPFSAVIVDESGRIVAEGVNRVLALHDCTAHAEIQAIRMATQQLKQVSLEGMTLIVSGEPCGFCYMAIKLAKISRVIVLVDRNEACQYGFDYRWTYELLQESKLQIETSKWPQLNHRLQPFRQSSIGLTSIGL
ncbi:nucleoside deaminase [Shewanella mangrovisoli]|uniref:nucleoside deaminase n=1 Tax=Shewanella mangrovisoli TaxID=2864211 RepID=UPI0035B84B83